MRRWLLAFVLLVVAAPGLAGQTATVVVVTNADLVSMTTAGLSDDVIISASSTGDESGLRPLA